MRLFTAVELPEQVCATLEEVVNRLRPTAPVAWSPRSNWHITTKFIGRWADDDIERLNNALAGVTAPPFDVQVRGLGWFPNPHHPSVLVAGVPSATGMAALHRATDEACAELGVKQELKPFSPHVTLARIKIKGALGGLKKAIAEEENLEFGSFTVQSYWLWQSETRPEGPAYKKLREFPLG